MIPDHLSHPDIINIRNLKAKEREQPVYDEYRQALEIMRGFSAQSIDLNNPVIRLGSKDNLDVEERRTIKQALEVFIPWKKGPFEIFGIPIDAEWRSDLKWERLLPHISPLQDRVVADIGCHNGYFMLRMVPHQPRLVVGFEPVPKLWFNFALLQHLAKCPQLVFEPLGVEHMQLYPQFFDTVFCLGILYHHPDPIGLLKKIHSSMKKDAELIVDCQGIPGELPLALVPEKRYAGATGMWFLPTVSCLAHWLKRSGFRQIECFYNQTLDSEEQRSTEWAPIKSLVDFLDPENPLLTIEGYPAPLRFYFKAIK
jgi:tRNA (mo5U34)-methyltransferase